MRPGVNMPRSKLSNLLVTTWLLGAVVTIGYKSPIDEELYQSFTKYEIVYPRIITYNENNNLSSTLLRDRRLPLRNHWEYTGGIYVIVKNWTLITRINDGLTFSKDFLNERHSFDRSFLDCDLRYGVLENNENSSSVVLTICSNEIYAFFVVDGKSYFVEPLGTNGRHIFYESNNTGWWSSKKLSRNFGPSNEISPFSYEKKKIELDGSSRLSKRDIPSVRSNGYYNLTGDVIDVMENFNLDPENNEESLKKTDEDVTTIEPSRNDSEDIGYFSNPSWSRTKVPSI